MAEHEAGLRAFVTRKAYELLSCVSIKQRVYQRYPPQVLYNAACYARRKGIQPTAKVIVNTIDYDYEGK